MARPLFEHYKDALRRGHVALLGGELDAALAAYREAAEIVPDRPLPHASIGTVLGRMGRTDEALAAFDRALGIAPDDDATLRARSEMVGGAEEGSAQRREHVQSREAGLSPAAGPADLPAHAAPEAVMAAIEAEVAAELGTDETAQPGAGEPPPAVRPARDPRLLQAEADAFLASGDPAAAREPLLLAMAAHREAGRLDASLDACLQLLAMAPGDPRVHLAIANLQLDRGWLPVATEKTELLLRLTSLTGDGAAEADVRRLVADRLGDASAERQDRRKRASAPS